MIRIESSALVRDSGTLPQPRSGLANARADAWPGGPSLENETSSHLFLGRVFLPSKSNDSQDTKINGVVCKLDTEVKRKCRKKIMRKRRKKKKKIQF